VRVGRAVALELEAQGLPVKISLSETGELKDYDYTIRLYEMLMADDVLSQAMDHYSFHSYWSNASEKAQAMRRFEAMPVTLPLYMSEWCEMEHVMDLGMDAALVLAREVHMDLTILSVISWSHWLGVSKYDYKDGLIYVNESDRSFTCSKRMWALGNYSRFVKEGYVRVKADMSGSLLSVSAYKSPDGAETVAVVINSSQNAQIMGIDIFDRGTTRVYITDEFNDSRDLYAELDDIWNFELPPRSVVTFVNTTKG
jgi:O-glycosyl hydrolase